MINQRIRELRRNLHLSQKDFGEKLGLSQTHIASLETEKRTVTQRIINDVCRIYGVNRDWLTDGTIPMYTDALKDLEVGEDVKSIANQYIRLEDKDRKLVGELISSLLEKN